jgi:SHS2 domain-containing protein
VFELYVGKIVYTDPKRRFDFLEHISDVYVRARGDSVISLLENAGVALFETMVDTSSLQERISRDVEAEGFDLENLLYRWLESLLTLYYSERIMCRDIRVNRLVVERQGEELRYSVIGRCLGEFFDPARHEGRVEVKAVTYSLMRIVKEDEWLAYFVLDI